MAISLNINGKSHSVNSDPDTPLLWVIRDELRLTGTKYGCGIAHCGACTVQLDGTAVRSCQVAVGDVGEASVTTIEGVSGDEGAVSQSNFHDYETLRIYDLSNIETHIVASAEAPTGVGEPSTPPAGPALANAIVAAGQPLVSHLPMSSNGVKFS